MVQVIGGHVTSHNVFDFGSDTKPRNLKYDISLDSLFFADFDKVYLKQKGCQYNYFCLSFWSFGNRF